LEARLAAGVFLNHVQSRTDLSDEQRAALERVRDDSVAFHHVVNAIMDQHYRPKLQELSAIFAENAVAAPEFVGKQYGWDVIAEHAAIINRNQNAPAPAPAPPAPPVPPPIPIPTNPQHPLIAKIVAWLNSSGFVAIYDIVAVLVTLFYHIPMPIIPVPKPTPAT
jgi:hypothetical protein